MMINDITNFVCMRNSMKQLFSMHFSVLLVDGTAIRLDGQNVFRFEHIGTEQGLSQNTGSSILFDSKGFMWIGTMNGLNRYDGYEFKIFKGQSASARNFTNNRVTRLWEDKKGFIWAETYDGYYHFFNPESEIFSTIPNYEEQCCKKHKINSFLQYTDDIIITGIFKCRNFYTCSMIRKKATYTVSQYLDKGNYPLSNNNVRFIHADKSHNIWIGTSKGINYLSRRGFQQAAVQFPASICECIFYFSL